jgi:hypothetical protein
MKGGGVADSTASSSHFLACQKGETYINQDYSWSSPSQNIWIWEKIKWMRFGLSFDFNYLGSTCSSIVVEGGIKS